MAKGHQVRQKLVSYPSMDASMENTTNDRKRSGSTHKDVGNRIEDPQRYNLKDKKSSVHTITSMKLEHYEINDQFSEVRLLVDGRNARVYSGYHNTSDSWMALKCVNKDCTKNKDFLKEIHYNYYLSPHPNIVTSYNVAFNTDTSYIFAQELAPEGDLSFFLERRRLNESQAKSVLEQITFALEFIHSKDIVHRDISLDNIFVFSKELSTVKLGDFSETHRAGSMVKKIAGRSQWSPPEVCEAAHDEPFQAHTSQDAWELGIFIFVLLTRSFPWKLADISDKNYNIWTAFVTRKTCITPKPFRVFTPRLLRLLRRLLEPNSEKRAKVQEVYKYLNDVWFVKDNSDTHSETLPPYQENCYSDSSNSFEDPMNFCGIETTSNDREVNRRVCQWILDAPPTTEGYTDVLENSDYTKGR